MKEELKPILQEIGIDEKAILKSINSIAMSSEKKMKQDLKLYLNYLI